ncbi:MAG: 2,3-bisphosphoglycerate-independent phosphoglycerate mutase [Clostridium sp.]|nr:MAG: 2,3-bisphosphoglycerate-independent phosphoglycerate mutase [Clostridium sp.]
MNKRPVMLIIMDGYGIAAPSEGNAVSLAKKPVLDELMKKYDTKTLRASGSAVGLPDGQMGNSEVGHMNIGAGRIVWQSLSRINNAINDGSFNEIEAFKDAIANAKKHNSKLHIFGLCSDGGVHSHTNHIIAIAKLAHSEGIKDVYLHAFLDGRDVAPTSAKTYLKKIVDGGNVKVATVGGRYYGMDRDKNYDRIQLAYDAMTIAKGEYYPDPFAGIDASYTNGKTDEFVIPFVSDKNGMVGDNDSVIFANFRPDRAIEIATAISNPNGIVYNPEKPYKLDISNAPKNVFFVSMMKYADSVKGPLAFELQTFENLYGDWVSKHNLTQLRIAETEKYAHVTFFFDGGADRAIPGAERILVNSPKVATYDLQPEMSAYEVTDKVVEAILSKKFDTIILNYANCDMVGHTGVIPAAVKAVETVDTCVGRCIEALNKVGGVALITADHGNAEKMLDENGKPFTAHTTNPVPVVITDDSIKLRDDGILSDIAPTLLELLGIESPKEMTSKSLIIKK